VRGWFRSWSFAPAWLALLSALVFASMAEAASPPGFRLVNTHRTPPVSALGHRPQACTVFPETGCLQRGSYGSVAFSPHILKPGGILTATVTPTGCANCAAVWPVSGPKATIEMFRFLTPLRGCGPLRCRWRVTRNAPETAYTVVFLDISPHPAANGPSSISSYAGIRSPWQYKYVP
jgi:hypothetical protein